MTPTAPSRNRAARRASKPKSKPKSKPEPQQEPEAEEPTPLLSLDTLAKERAHIRVNGELYPVAGAGDLSLRDRTKLARFITWVGNGLASWPDPPPEAILDEDHEFWTRDESEEEERLQALGSRGLKMIASILLREVPTETLDEFDEAQRLAVMNVFMEASAGDWMRDTLARLMMKAIDEESLTPANSSPDSTVSTAAPPVPSGTG